MVKKTAEKSYGGMVAQTSGSELSENKPRQNFHSGDITWVKHGVSSWWPAQVIDDASVSSKPKKKTRHDVLVRLYGTCQYLYVDPWKSNIEFEMILKKENKTAMEAFYKVLQKELTRFKSPSDHDEKPVSTKVDGKEGSRRSGRTNAKNYLDATHDSTSQLDDTSGSENVTEVGDVTPVKQSRHKKGSVVDGTHREIKAMVRDILLGDIIGRQHADEMTYVDGVIFGICDHGTTADTEGGRSIKRTGSGLEADSSNAAKRPRNGKVTNPETKDYQNTKNHSSPGRDAAMEGSEQHSARQIKIMQKLGLVAPPGSPFKGLVAAAHR